MAGRPQKKKSGLSSEALAFTERLDQVCEHVMSAERLADSIGVSVSTINNWRSGKYQPSLDEARNLAKTAGVRPQWLILGDGSPVHVAAEKSLGGLGEDPERYTGEPESAPHDLPPPEPQFFISEGGAITDEIFDELERMAERPDLQQRAVRALRFINVSGAGAPPPRSTKPEDR